MREPLKILMDLVFEEEKKPMSAMDMTRALSDRGWLPPFHTVLDIADEMKEWYGPCSSTP